MSQFLLNLSLVIFTTVPAFAEESFFVIGDEPARKFDASIQEQIHPISYFSEALEHLENEREWLARGIKSLVYFREKPAPGSGGYEPYNRKKHFGSWVKVDPNDRCLNTRAKILTLRSEVPVDYSSNGCVVQNGRWYDPYSNRVYTQASQVEIDHVVPLKNAYINGAHAWTKQKRCVYSNFMGNEFHLLAVESRENRSKSDRTPEGYIPPNREFTCQYLKHWLQIKLYWRLTLTPSEKNRIVELLKENQCSLEEMTYSEEEMREQQRKLAEGIIACS